MATPVTADTNPSSKSNSNLIYLQDMDELKRVFNRFDSNGDGKISVNELNNVLSTLGSSVPPDELQRVMNDLDTDHDGFISLSEFAVFCRSDTTDGGATELRDAFNLYDQDKNGLISSAELHLVLNRLGLKCSVEECHNMIKSVDSDGDGNVNFEEFKQMMSNNRINVKYLLSKQFDLNKLSDEDNDTLEDQQREDNIHVKKRCLNLNKKPWYGDKISNPVKREAHKLLTEYIEEEKIKPEVK
ncbi:hypothetical protein Ahy_B03g062393 isoform A [Arachis hypogaea]|uniref:EF-hand domain-containing protein n=1 Tax=Arachis hypogaea TaxID=3818 RepID=A0A444ZU43_ARAHY|nr:hypothetical protein Ahy_B03g062393 isoform A [Arachis hypogaea]